MIIVTAGHVDHGKTSLLQALTGTDADRLPEEKRRGMTIDLGYAFMDINRDQRLAFIDVPGHEKFINNMLCGISHARHAMLVVACDDGVMPQTQEHLQILSLLELETLTLVLTKCDRVEPARIAAVDAQLDHLLAGFPALSGAVTERFAVSSLSGVGIEDLKHYLCGLARQELAHQGGDCRSFRMNIDRAFTVKGAGLVVTGTVISGEVGLGNTLYCSGQKQPLRVRGVHAQGQLREQGRAGERVALNLTGGSHHHTPQRGDWLSALAQPEPCERVTVVYQGEYPPKHWQSAHFHHGANHTTGHIGYLSALDNGAHLLELVLDKPWLLACRDLIVIRDAGGKQTLGGARVIELNPPARGKRKPERLTQLSALAECSTASAALAQRLMDNVVSEPAFCWDWQLSPQAAEALVYGLQESGIVLNRVADYLVGDKPVVALTARLLGLLNQYHDAHPDELGLARPRLGRMLQAKMPQEVLDFALNSLLEQGELQQQRGLLHLPRHQINLTAAESALWQRMQTQMQADPQPLWVTDFATELGEDAAVIRPLCYKLVQLGYLTAVVRDRYLATEQVYGYAALIRHYLASHDALETAAFRQLINLGRKVSIQVLEMFDKSGFTRRKFQSNARTLRDENLFISEE